MKNKYFIAIVLPFLTLIVMGQKDQPIDTTRWLCTYNYEFLQDSTSLISLKSQEMILQIGSHSSKFCNRIDLTSDSLLNEYSNIDRSVAVDKVISQMNGNFTHIFSRYRIYKNLHGRGSLTFSSYQNRKYFLVNQLYTFNWKLALNKDTTILGYKCKQARTHYAGRNYIAWFSPEIPINDGPYKFSGLPGLILKISDTKNQHRFILTGFRKVKYNQPIIFRNYNFLEVSPEEFVKLLTANIARQTDMVQRGDNIKFSDDEGKARSLQGLKAKNNFIERY